VFDNKMHNVETRKNAWNKPHRSARTGSESQGILFWLQVWGLDSY